MPSKKKTVTLEQVFEKLTGHDKQFAALAKHLFSFEDDLKKEVGKLDKRIQAIEANLEKLTDDLETLTEEYHAITVGLKRLEAAVGVGSAGKGKTSIQSELKSMKTRLSVVEGKVMAMESRAEEPHV